MRSWRFRGHVDDGRRHVADALARGAVVVVSDDDVEAPGAVRVRCADPRRLLARLAARLAGDPSAALTLVGITGTNGKTTTTYLLEGIWRAAGARTGVIGTISYRVGDDERPAPFTTPEAPELQAPARRHAAGGRHARRHGGVVACPGAAPRRTVSGSTRRPSAT